MSILSVPELSDARHILSLIRLAQDWTCLDTQGITLLPLTEQHVIPLDDCWAMLGAGHEKRGNDAFSQRLRQSRAFLTRNASQVIRSDYAEPQFSIRRAAQGQDPENERDIATYYTDTRLLDIHHALGATHLTLIARPRVSPLKVGGFPVQWRCLATQGGVTIQGVFHQGCPPPKLERAMQSVTTQMQQLIPGPFSLDFLAASDHHLVLTGRGLHTTDQPLTPKG